MTYVKGSFRKTVVALIAAVVTIAGEALTAGLVHGDAARWLALAIAAAGSLSAALAVYTVPNAPAVPVPVGGARGPLPADRTP
jgi:hypothetical protein